MKTVPIATIVIATHDRPSLVGRAIASACRQTEPSVEIIVVDDGSRPPVRLGDDPRLRLVRIERSGGVCAARNAGLAAASAPWVTFLDDDDELMPSMVQRSLEAARATTLPDPVAVLSGIEEVDASGNVVAIHLPARMPRGSRYFLEDVRDGDFKTENTLFAPTDLVRAIGGWDAAIRSWEHDDLFQRLNAACSLERVPAVAYRLHRHDGARRRRHMLDRANGMATTFRKHRRVFARYPDRAARYLGTMGVTYLQAGRWRSAVAATTRAVVRDPRQARLWWWWFASIAGPGGLAGYRLGRRMILGHAAPSDPSRSLSRRGSSSDEPVAQAEAGGSRCP